MKAGKGEFMRRALVHESVTDEEGGRDGREELVSPTSEADFSVPFFLRAVQFSALNEAKVEIRVQYKDVTSGIFKDIGKSILARPPALSSRLSSSLTPLSFFFFLLLFSQERVGHPNPAVRTLFSSLVSKQRSLTFLSLSSPSLRPVPKPST